MITETAPQALFLVPMAIALGFGVLVSGLLLLVWVPAGRLLLHDLSGRRVGAVRAPPTPDATRAGPGELSAGRP